MARRSRRLRPQPVQVPLEVPSTDAVFILLRRMRMPIVLLIVIFNIAVIGLTQIPGEDADGNVRMMTVLEAFYFVSYTAMTIGYGEMPYAFTSAQRLWVTVIIYATVIGWAYLLAALLGLVQEDGFRTAVAAQRFRRKVRAIREPFQIIAGYGHAGRVIGLSLDDAAHRFVVLDADPERIQVLQTDPLHADVPQLVGDARRPGILGLAGLGHPQCEGVLAITDRDEVNLSVVMAVRLLRPELPVVARCDDRRQAERMKDFGISSIINPYDRYGEYLVMALKRPSAYQLVTWLTSPAGTPLPPYRPGLADGLWVVCGQTEFGQEVAADLRAAGLEVSIVDGDDDDAYDCGQIVGLVAATDHDSTNLSIAAHARRLNPDLYLSVRQESHRTGPLVTAFDFDSVLIPSEIVAREALTRVVAPVYWRVLRFVTRQKDEWAEAMLARIRDACGDTIPNTTLLHIDTIDAPAMARWLSKGGRLRLGDVLRHPDDRAPIAAIPLVHVRGKEYTFFPDDDQPLTHDDRVVLLATDPAVDALDENTFYPQKLEYAATGQYIPATWFWRRVLRHRYSETFTEDSDPAGSPK